MRLFKTVPKIDFMRLRRFWLGFSTVTSLLAIAVILIKGFHFGIDFTGGTLIELTYPQPMQTETVRDTLAQAGYGDTVVQHFGTTHDVLVRMPPREGLTSAEISNKVVDALKAAGQEAELRRVEFVGPQVGAELAENGALALIFALIGILVYIALRFESKLALAAVVATLHDTLLTAGFYALLPWDFDLTVLAALLTVVGYSLNDTIVIFDRIRSNLLTDGKREPLQSIVDRSLRETLTRTLNTGTGALIMLFVLFFFAAESIRWFILTMIVGTIIGTYSSFFVASPLLVWWQKRRGRQT